MQSMARFLAIFSFETQEQPDMCKLCWTLLILLVLAVAGVAYKVIVVGKVELAEDGRQALKLTPGERNLVLGEMRDFLVAVQGIIEATNREDMGPLPLPRAGWAWRPRRRYPGAHRQAAAGVQETGFRHPPQVRRPGAGCRAAGRSRAHPRSAGHPHGQLHRLPRQLQPGRRGRRSVIPSAGFRCAAIP